MPSPRHRPGGGAVGWRLARRQTGSRVHSVPAPGQDGRGALAKGVGVRSRASAARSAVSRPPNLGTGRSPAFEPDRVVGVLATDGYHVHQLVYAAFARDGARPFLFCPVAVSGPAYRVRVRPCDIETRFAEGQEFSMNLRAMPTVKMAGKRRSIGRARAKDRLRLRWIHAREHGFALRSEPELRVERVRFEAVRIPFGVNVCTYCGAAAATECPCARCRNAGRSCIPVVTRAM